MSRALGDDLPEYDPEPAPPPRPRARAPKVGENAFQPAPSPSPAPARPASAGGAKKARRPAGDPAEPREVTGPGPTWAERILFGSVSSGHLATFCGQFSSYQEAGVDLVRSLRGLGRQFQRTALGPVIGRMEQGVRAGETLADTMKREPQAFDKLCLAMMRVAEARGGVPETLRLLARHYEARQRLIRQARSALIYPAIVVALASTVALLLAIYILPMFAAMLADIARGGKVDLPLPSRVLMGVSGFMTSHGWWLVPAAAIGTLVALVRWYKTRSGREVLDSLSLYVPVLGRIRRKIETGRFARTLAALLNAGVDVDSSLKLTGDVLAIPSFRRAVGGARSLVLEGSDLSDAIDRSRRFGPDVVAIVESGEESGRIPEALDKVADDYEEQVEYLVKNLGQLIQPILMLGIGGLVFFIILAVLLPYINLLTSLAG